MNEHTPEPWEVAHEWDGEPRLAIRNKMQEPAKPGDSTHEIAHISGYLGATEADARRIVACVNACRGLSIEELETDITESHSVTMSKDRYLGWMRERGEARAMVAELLTIVKNEEWTPWDGTAEPVWCRSCHGTVRMCHKTDCGKASAVAKAEAMI